MIRTVTALLMGLFIVVIVATFLQIKNSNEYVQVGEPKIGSDPTFFVDSVTEESLKLAYSQASVPLGPLQAKKLKILVVPGHDPDSYGTQFQGLKEHELTVDLGEKVYDLLKQEPFFDVQITQTKDGFNPVFTKYFEENREAVAEFVEKQKQAMEHFVENGLIEPVVTVVHNTVPDDVALRLYAINKWANENNIDIVLHVHFNDYPGRTRTLPGKYSGFSIYVPESQYSNSKGSKALADIMHKTLAEFYPESNYPREAAGVIEDQELIAIGANNTLDAASLLIEYGYIYEPGFTESALRETVLGDLAIKTYLGTMRFFDAQVRAGGKFSTNLLPHTWGLDLKKGEEGNLDVLSLQKALMVEGVYPPINKTKNDCALTGFFGPCTEKSVAAFQEKHGILPATGFVGELTRAKLNELY